ncbi:hypothetical protein EYR40_009251 [Pleurotus pulmonarius]|nr:hypothetical protein EYR36_005378 [Pleurotus pulmonarius]KAF4590356.1 hypothetical protein EYR38_009655 [Pleurotus pulmonarius]KAF4590655.1 hypothetical protein EYR40_009251 [Pleurotus pulmonarius]
MFSLVSFIVALFFTMLASNASPVPSTNGTTHELDKRVDHWGRGTYYYQTGNAGNCGFWDKDSSPIIAISLARYRDNNGGNCNQWIEIINTKNGKRAYGKTRDSCPGCGTEDLDMSPSLFKQLGSLDEGVLSIKWHFMNKAWSP